ncbi:MAG: cysteate racemase [Planctomycetota bacterium]|jgi:aspartate racemase
MREKTIGILGGMGPYATADLFGKILEHTPAKKDWEHLRIIIDNNPKIPSRTRAILYDEESPVAMMIETARNLQMAGADFVVIPCNSAHVFLPEVLSSVEIPILDMIAQTVDYIAKESQQITAVGLLAAKIVVDARLYQARLEAVSIKTVTPTDDQQPKVREVIEDVKLNRNSEGVKSKLADLIGALTTQGAQAIIAGCTEISIVAKSLVVDVPIFDSNEILAKAAVKMARSS